MRLTARHHNALTRAHRQAGLALAPKVLSTALQDQDSVGVVAMPVKLVLLALLEVPGHQRKVLIGMEADDGGALLGKMPESVGVEHASLRQIHCLPLLTLGHSVRLQLPGGIACAVLPNLCRAPRPAWPSAPAGRGRAPGRDRSSQNRRP